MSGQHVTWTELLPVVRKALPFESEFSDTVAHNVALAVSAYLLNRNALHEPGLDAALADASGDDHGQRPGRRRDGRGQGQRVATAAPVDVASGHTAVAIGHDADGHVTMEVVPRAPGPLTKVSYWVGDGGRGCVRSESASESRWTGSHYATAEKLAAEHGLRVKRVGNDGVTSWTRS